MTLTPDYLREQIAALEAQQRQHELDWNKVEGALEALRQLLARVEASEPEVPSEAPA